ncbi:MAG: HAMP domain-containing sensor histidine kinase, partial [Dermatophilaceae bacterium]
MSELRRWAGRAHDRAVHPLRSWSLTWRLVAVTVVLLIGALVLTGTASQALLRTSLMERTDEGLQAAAINASATSRRDLYADGHVYAPRMPSSYAIAFMDSSGQIVSRAPAIDEPRAFPDIPPIPIIASLPLKTTPFEVSSEGGNEPRWQVLVGPLSDGTGTYAVATSLRGVQATMVSIRVLTLTIGLIVATVCALVGWLGIKRAFRPLREMEDTAAAIAGGDLTRRVPEHAANDEAASLSRSLNTMLAHIERSFAAREASEERMRRFVTDASHELRTPLATVRGYAELYRQGAVQTPEATTGAMRRIEDEATRMSGLVDDLLTLARLDNHRPLGFGEVDLTVLAADAVDDATARQPDRRFRLVGLGEGPLAPTPLVGDESRLRQVVTNLMANAVQHTPATTPIDVAVGRVAPGYDTPGPRAADAPAESGAKFSGRKRIPPPPRAIAWSRGTSQTPALPVPSALSSASGSRPAPGLVRVEVIDHGPGIAGDDVERVFQRFYRGDPSRGRTSGGTGLGLAIVIAIVASHGGRVGIRPTSGGGATFVVELPTAPPGWKPAGGPAGIDRSTSPDTELSEFPDTSRSGLRRGAIDTGSGRPRTQ